MWSIVVVVVLSALGMAPGTIFAQLAVIVRGISGLGLSAIHSVFEYLIVEAVIVVSAWPIMTLLRGRVGAR